MMKKCIMAAVVLALGLMLAGCAEQGKTQKETPEAGTVVTESSDEGAGEAAAESSNENASANEDEADEAEAQAAIEGDIDDASDDAVVMAEMEDEVMEGDPVDNELYPDFEDESGEEDFSDEELIDDSWIDMIDNGGARAE